MVHLICDNKLTFLSNKHKSLLNDHFREPLRTAQPREIAIKLGIEYAQVVAIFVVLASVDFCDNWLLIYHSCADTFVDRTPLSDGPPALPYTCPYCETLIEDYEELQFDVMAETDEPIQFI